MTTLMLFIATVVLASAFAFGFVNDTGTKDKGIGYIGPPVVEPVKK